MYLGRCIAGVCAGIALVSPPGLAGSTAPHPGPTAGPKKLALIVAIGAYEPQSGYPRLSSAHDVPLVRDALIAQGFDSTNIRILRDAEATRAGILAGFQWLEERTSPGDVVVFHYSGHGQQITDTTGTEPDGLDETLVPYGAPVDTLVAHTKYGLANYRGERHLIDKTLGVILTELRRRAGPTGNVIWFVDACYSGSITRGEELPVRGVGTPIRFAAPASRALGRTRAASGLDLGHGSAQAGLAPYAVISATQFDHTDRETLDEAHDTVGPLSLAISRALPKVDSATSYRELFDRIAVLMSAMYLGGQEPQLEGNADTRVFNGKAVSAERYFTVTVVSDTLVRLNGGRLLGVSPGAVVAFRQPGLRGEGAPGLLDSGTVLAASDLEATVRVRGHASADQLRGSWARVTGYSYGNQRIGVGFDPRLPAALQGALRAELAKLAAIDVGATSPDLRVLPGAGSPATRRAGALLVAASGDTISRIVVAADSLAPVVRDEVQAVARSTFFRRLDMKDPHLKLTMEAIPASSPVRRVARGGGMPDSIACPGRGDTASAAAGRTAGGALEMSPDAAYWIRIRNQGDVPAYFSILDLQSDYSVSALYPTAGVLLSDLVLGRAAVYTIPTCFFATEPYGIEILKLIATTERVDFTPILSPGLVSRGAFDGPLAQLFSDGYRGMRGPATVPAGKAVTSEVTLHIVRAHP